MTPEHIELHRKRFEELSGFDKNYLMRNMHGDYFYHETRHQFKGYLMCAENQIVELPKPALFYNAKIIYLDELTEKLESQGIKVKE